MSSGSSSSPSSTSSDLPGGPRRIPTLGWALAFAAAAILITLAWAALRGARPAPLPNQPARLERLIKAPDFELLTHEGGKLSRANLGGTIWVANFIFTRCTGPCPLLTSHMAELQQKLGRTRPEDVQLISLTVDPAHDTPEVLRQYAQAIGADPARWRFLTGPPAQVEAVIKKGFLQPLTYAESGEPVHSARFVVVDREGWIRAFPDGNDPEIIQKLLMDIGDLLRENPKK